MTDPSSHAGWWLAAAFGLCALGLHAAHSEPSLTSIASSSEGRPSTSDALALIDDVIDEGALDRKSSARLRRFFHQLDHDGRIAMLAAFHRAYSLERITVDDPTLIPF